MKDNPSASTLSVSELNRRAKSLLELHLNQIWVEGEVSNFSQPGSGHWYFTLKDDKAQIRCAMFRNRNLLVKTKVKAGDQVKVRARVSIYEARGDYQLIADHLEPPGEGALQLQFEQLKNKLSKEGLFDSDHKRAIPAFVQKLAVISSPTGAAVHDILQVLARRNPAIEVILVPSVVQGEEAPTSLCSALRRAFAIEGLDAIIIGRGGGSLEDLWAFNDEKLARLIFESEIPIVSAVGHEVDFSISDFVADLRAPTPSAAAELVSFDRNSVLNNLQSQRQRLSQSIIKQLRSFRNETLHLSKRLKHPGDKINQWQQRTDYCEGRLIEALQKNINTKQQSLMLAKQALRAQSPDAAIDDAATRLKSVRERLTSSTLYALDKKRMSFIKTSNTLNIVSPLATLERGYTITKSKDGSIVRKVTSLEEKQAVELTFHDGKALAEITGINKSG